MRRRMMAKSEYYNLNKLMKQNIVCDIMIGGRCSGKIVALTRFKKLRDIHPSVECENYNMNEEGNDGKE